MTAIPGSNRRGGEKRRARLVTQLTGDEGTEVDTALLCQVCADATGMTGAGITLSSDDGRSQSSAGASDDVSARIEELQFTLGEGPAVEAYEQNRPILEPDLAGSAASRWFGFTASAVEAGVRAVFGFPLHVGAVRFGALTLYCDQPGPLNQEQYADALAMAEVATEALLLIQASAPVGFLARELAATAHQRSVVHQAAGMISAQLNVSVGQALVRLRANAFATERRIVHVADDIVHRRLRFGSQGGLTQH